MIQVGHEHQGAGDVNGDGYDDLLTRGGVFDPSSLSYYSPRLFLFHGSPGGLEPTPAWTATPLTQNPRDFGDFFEGVGDVNGDGYDDVVTNAYGEAYPVYYDPSNRNLFYNYAPGTAYLYLGGPKGLTAQPVWSAHQPESYFGVAIAAAGDVDGDGYADVLIGTPGTPSTATVIGSGVPIYYDPPCWEEAVYLYRGGPMGLELDPSWVQRPEIKLGCFGFSLDSAGDVNNDGYDDVIISAFLQERGDMVNKGRVYAYYGSAQGLAQQPSWEAPLPAGATQTLTLGNVVNGIGDIDLDGYDDVMLMAFFHLQDAAVASHYALFRGSAQGLSLTPDRIITGTGTRYDTDIMGRHDINGDGIPDLIVGQGPELSYKESFRVFHGQTTWPYISQTPAFSANRSNFFLPYSGWTHLYSFPGDLNNDGYADVTVPNPQGLVVLFGGPNPAPLVADQQLFTLANQQLSITLEASDLHEDPLTLSITSPPSLGALDLTDLANGLVVYRPYADKVGQDIFEYTAVDPYGNASSATVSVRIESANTPPVFETELQIIKTFVGDLVELTVVAIDADGDTLTYSIQPEIDGATIDPQSGQFSWTPQPSQEGFSTLSFFVTDGLAQVALQVTLEIGPKPLDRDEDGVPDDEDACPDERGTPQNQGCPEKEDMSAPMEMDALDMAPDLSSQDMADVSDMAVEELDMSKRDAGQEQPEPTNSGCGGCQSAAPSTPSSLMWGLLALGALGLRRRRSLLRRMRWPT